MGRILNFAKAAAGAVSLHSTVGKWMTEVSKAVDKIDAGAPYIQATKTHGATQLLNVGDDLVVDTVVASRGLTLDAGNGRVLLRGGNTYHLLAHGVLAFSDPAGDATLSWVVSTTGEQLGVLDVINSSSNTVQVGYSGVVEAFYSPGTDFEVSVRVVAITLGTASLNPSKNFSVSVTQLT